MMVEVLFPVLGTTVPIDHAYELFSAVSRIVSEFHRSESRLRLSPIVGQPGEPGRMLLNEHSRLCVRCPEDAVRVVLPLAGKALALGHSSIRLGVPSIRTLIPAASLIARVVTFKNATTPETFLQTARQKLADLGVAGEPSMPIHTVGERAGEPQRKIIRIHGVAIVGYTLLVDSLTPEHSLVLQEHGLGGRTHMGCGFFVPAQETRR